MEPRDDVPAGVTDAKPPSLHEVQRAIERLDRADRAMLRPWILARYDVRGYRATGFVAPRVSEA
jgi:hypothetical protein